MIVDTNNLPDWAIYVFIGAGILTIVLIIWTIEYILGCLTCEPCRKCYKRSKHLFYFLFCCCLCPKNSNEIQYTRVDALI